VEFRMCREAILKIAALENHLAQGREVIPLCATLAALLELPRRNMLVSNYPRKLETDVLKRTRDLAGEQSLCGYNTKRHKREQECIFNKRLGASFFAHTKVSEKAHLRDGLVISRTVYIRAEHFRAIGDYSVGDQINFPRVCEMAGLDCAYLRKKPEAVLRA